MASPPHGAETITLSNLVRRNPLGGLFFIFGRAFEWIKEARLFRLPSSFAALPTTVKGGNSTKRAVGGASTTIVSASSACVRLRSEVEDIIRNPPDYVSRIRPVRVPTLICDNVGDLTRNATENDGPWDFVVSVRGGVPDEERQELVKSTSRISQLRIAAADATSANVAGMKALKEATLFFEACEARNSAPSVYTRPSVGTWFISRRGPQSEGDPLEEAASKVQDLQTKATQLKEAQAEAVRSLRKAEDDKQRLATSNAYDFPFRVRIRFNSQWPKKPPSQVQFQCVFHHALTDEEECMPLPFFKALPQENGEFTVRGVLEAIHRFLVNPMDAWGMAPHSVPQRFHESMDDYQQQSISRLSRIRKYAKLVRHPDLFAEEAGWHREAFTPEFYDAMHRNSPKAWRKLSTEHVAGNIYSFPMFTDAFCDKFLQEIFNFYESGLPAKRPNSMNNYGIIINEIGLEPFVDELQRILQPVGEIFFPGPGNMWDSHHCFIVRYREGEDLGLDMHTDDSDVTFNICLGREFESAGLHFCGVMGAEDHRKHRYTYKHKKGDCIFHLGRQRHGAGDISSGERLNLILWNHGKSTYRLSTEYLDPPYAKEGKVPDKVCLSYTHDRDFGIFNSYPVGKEKFDGKGWCPPHDCEYDGFKAERTRNQSSP